MPAQIGYAELVRRVTGRELSKAHTRTDWSRRPLSAEQIDYALDDVRLSAAGARAPDRGADPARPHVLAGSRNWQRCRIRAATASIPEAAWLRVRSLKGLDPDRARLAQSLAAWRERRADERNRPRGWILDDAVLRDIVVRVPRTLEDLAALPDMQPGFIKHNGAEILATDCRGRDAGGAAAHQPARRARPAEDGAGEEACPPCTSRWRPNLICRRRSWRPGATSNSLPTVAGMAPCCAGGGAKSSVSGCWRRYDGADGRHRRSGTRGSAPAPRG